MKTPLDIIENRLKTFIEASAQLLPESLRRQSLAELLVTAMRASLEVSENGEISAPPFYTIFVHPDSLAHWAGKSEVFAILAEELDAAAAESGITFAHTPVIRILPDAQLFTDAARIESSYFQDRISHTSAIPVTSDLPPVREVIDPRPQNAFLIIDNQTILLRDAVINIGRRLDNHIIIEDPRVSRSHAQLRAVRGHYVIFDLNSTGGTAVNNQRIDQQTLKPGDVISLAGVPLIYGEDRDSLVDDTGELPGLIDPHNPKQESSQ